MEKIETIIFDLGRVLMHIDFDAFPNNLGIYSEDDRNVYRPRVGNLWKLYETGKMSTEEFLNFMFPIFDGRFSKEKLLKSWDSIIVEENKEIVSLVARVQKKYATAILSNTSKSHWERSLKISSLIRSFSISFTSFEIGVMKPDPMIYQTVIERMGGDPASMVFIDDLQENIDAAVAAGMKGIVFHSVDQTEKDLKVLGVEC